MLRASFMAEVVRAERTINAIISSCNLHGGGCFIVSKDKDGHFQRLDGPISIVYFCPEDEVWPIGGRCGNEDR